MRFADKLIFLLIMFSSSVLANNPFEDFVYFIEDMGSDLAFFKFAIFIILLLVVYWSLMRTVFQGNKTLSIIFALAVAFLGVRFMPYDFFDYFEYGFNIFLFFILLIAPWFVLSRFVGIRLKSFFGVVVYFLVYASIGYGLYEWGLFYDLSNTFFFDEIQYFIQNKPMLVIISALVIVFIILLRFLPKEPRN